MIPSTMKLSFKGEPLGSLSNSLMLKVTSF